MGGVFLIIDGITIEDLGQDDFKVYEKELAYTDRMLSGRLVEELQAKVWCIEVDFGMVSADVLEPLSEKLSDPNQRTHQIFFLPPNGGTDMISSRFHVMKTPTPSLSLWTGDFPIWNSYSLTFEEVNGHD